MPHIDYPFPVSFITVASAAPLKEFTRGLVLQSDLYEDHCETENGDGNVQSVLQGWRICVVPNSVYTSP